MNGIALFLSKKDVAETIVNSSGKLRSFTSLENLLMELPHNQTEMSISRHKSRG